MTEGSSPKKQVTFGGLENPYPFPIAKPPEKKPGKKRTKNSDGTLDFTNELSAVIKLGRRQRRPGILISMEETFGDEGSQASSEDSGSCAEISAAEVQFLMLSPLWK